MVVHYMNRYGHIPCHRAGPAYYQDGKRNWTKKIEKVTCLCCQQTYDYREDANHDPETTD